MSTRGPDSGIVQNWRIVFFVVATLLGILFIIVSSVVGG